MEKRKITAREIMKDLRAGFNDRELMQKYNLSAQALQSVYSKLLKAGIITEGELEERIPMNERTVDLGLFICPACGNIQGKEFVKCSRCSYELPQRSGVNAANGAKKQPKSIATTVIEPRITEEPKPVKTTQVNTVIPSDSLEKLQKTFRESKILAIIGLIGYLLIPIVLLVISNIFVDNDLLRYTISSIVIAIPILVLAALFLLLIRGLGESLKFFTEVSKSQSERSI